MWIDGNRICVQNDPVCILIRNHEITRQQVAARAADRHRKTRRVPRKAPLLRLMTFCTRSVATATP